MRYEDKRKKLSGTLLTDVKPGDLFEFIGGGPFVGQKFLRTSCTLTGTAFVNVYDGAVYSGMSAYGDRLVVILDAKVVIE